MRIDRQSFALTPGTCLWMRPGRTYLAEQDDQDRLGVSFVHFTLSKSNSIAPPFEITTVRSLDFAAASMAEVVRWADSDAALAGRLLGTTLDVLARDHMASTTHESNRANGPRRRQESIVHAITARISAEPGQPWSIAQLAAESGYAPDHFSKVFTAVIGMRPQAFIVQARMMRARMLLAETGLSVGEIATALGFNDVYFFSRQFRAKCGVPPTAYRRGIRNADR